MYTLENICVSVYCIRELIYIIVVVFIVCYAMAVHINIHFRNLRRSNENLQLQQFTI